MVGHSITEMVLKILTSKDAENKYAIVQRKRKDNMWIWCSHNKI